MHRINFGQGNLIIKRPISLAAAGLFILIALALAYTASQGVSEGWYRWMPGPMSRHRDAVAVALTKVVYKQWHGYACYRAVNHALLEHGMGVQPEIAIRVGSPSYLDVISTPRLVDAALAAASALPHPEQEGWYYSQDEKGMAVLYILAFEIFGVSSASLYWLYILIYSVAVLSACLVFRKQPGVLFFFLVAICTHDFIAKMIPAMPRGDVCVIYGNRFIGILGSIPMFYLMFLMVSRIRMSFWPLAVAIGQSVLLYVLINARTTTEWLPISVTLVAAALWISWLYQHRRRRQAAERPIIWPIVAMMLMLISASCVEHWAEDPAFHDGREQGGHAFWVNFITALHNNPERTVRYGIPASIGISDDWLMIFIADREIARRKEDHSKYIINNPDWIYRSTSPDTTFRWREYDGVLRDVFLRTILHDPLYALNSLFIQQPLLAAETLGGRRFLRSGLWFDLIPGLLIIVGLWPSMASSFSERRSQICILVAATFGVLIPVMAAAVSDLRVVELFYILLLDFAMAASILVTSLARWLLAEN